MPTERKHPTTPPAPDIMGGPDPVPPPADAEVMGRPDRVPPPADAEVMGTPDAARTDESDNDATASD